MPGCPACGADVSEAATECPRCHLAVHLFEPVREAVGVPESDPSYAQEIRDLLAAVEPVEGAAEGAPPASGARIAYPARFPAPAAPATAFPDGPAAPVLDVIPALPALPGGGVEGLRRQLDELLHLAERRGVDAGGITDRVHEAVAAQDATTLEALTREMFVRLAATIAEEYEEVAAQRNGLATLIATGAPDVELGAAREALGLGDLAGAERRLERAREALQGLEEEWETVQILIAECDLLAETIRELGGDPGPALGPLEEGRRVARSGSRGEAEPVLAKAALALWAVLNPRFGPEMHRVKDALLAQRAAGVDITPALAQVRELSQHLARRNFGAAIGCYRWLRAFAAVPQPSAAAGGAGAPGPK